MVNSDPNYQRQQLDSLLEEICEMKQVFLDIHDDLQQLVKLAVTHEVQRATQLRKGLE